MRRIAMLSSCALLSIVAAASLHAAAKPAANGAEAAIRRAERDFVAAWNAHDARRMATFWDADGDLINPMGQHAMGRAEVEKLLAHEQSTIFKGSTYAIDRETIRMLSPTIAASDWEATITGMTAPDGTAAPPFAHHVTVILRLDGGMWRAMVARPVQYPPMPPG